MRTVHALSFSSLLGTLLLSTPSPAEPAQLPKAVAEAMTQKARQLYADGVRLYAQARWADARASFFAAWALSKHYTIAGNLADCELRLGLYRDAADHLALYVREIEQDKTSSPQERKDGRDKYAQARAKVGVVDVVVDPPGAEVYVDGKPAGAAPLVDPVFVEPGAHTIEARSEGLPSVRAAVEAKAGAAQPVALVLRRPAQAPPLLAPPQAPHAGSGPAQTPPPERRSVVPGAVLGGVAGAALVTGIGLVAVGANKLSTSKSLSQQITQAHHSCVSGAANFDPQCPTLQSTSSTSDTLDRVGVGLLIGAGAAAVGSVVYFLLPTPKHRATNEGAAYVAPVVSTNGGGVLLSGAF